MPYPSLIYLGEDKSPLLKVFSENAEETAPLTIILCKTFNFQAWTAVKEKKSNSQWKEV